MICTQNLRKLKSSEKRKAVVNRLAKMGRQTPMLAGLQEVNQEAWAAETYSESHTNLKLTAMGDPQHPSRLRFLLNPAALSMVMPAGIIMQKRWNVIHMKGLIVFNVHLLS